MEPLKYAQVFMINEAECETCNRRTMHCWALESNNKQMTRARRVKQCTVCYEISLAPKENDHR